jgi:hypothetical protein
MVKTLPRKVRKPRESTPFYKKIGKGNSNSPEAKIRHGRVLQLVQAWALAFKEQQSYAEFRRVYGLLLDRGVLFPEPRQEDAVPINIPEPVAPEVQEQAPQVIPLEDIAPATKVEAALPLRELSMPENRVSTDCASIFLEMLSITEPGENLKRNELLQEFLSTIRIAHGNNLARLHTTAEDWALDELLHVNEILLRSVSYYNGVSRGTISSTELKFLSAQVMSPNGKSQQGRHDESSDEGSDSDSSEEGGPGGQKTPTRKGEHSLAPPPSSGRRGRARSTNKEEEETKKSEPAAPTAEPDLNDFFSGGSSSVPVASSSSASSSAPVAPVSFDPFAQLAQRKPTDQLPAYTNQQQPGYGGSPQGYPPSSQGVYQQAPPEYGQQQPQQATPPQKKVADDPFAMLARRS